MEVKEEKDEEEKEEKLREVVRMEEKCQKIEKSCSKSSVNARVSWKETKF